MEIELNQKREESVYIPEIIDAGKQEGHLRLLQLKAELNSNSILDNYFQQQTELIKLAHPKKAFTAGELNEIRLELERKNDPDKSGLWIYYPWRNSLIHISGKEDFIKLRTARNKYKLTESEQHKLSQKKIGIIGLSVGHCVAMNLVLERSVGELRLADFDSLELTNLNRIRSSLVNLNLPKVILAAREIAELDPFIKVRCFEKGITEENLDHFFTENGILDLLVEECDSLHIKILSRQKAKELKIPVLMETSDRGMLDVERFDLEPERPILHGLIEHLDLNTVKDLISSEEKVPFLLPMVGIESASTRLKASAFEIGNTIGTWPQLGTSVMLGGAMVADTSRRILLDDFRLSGRFILDPAEILKGIENNFPAKPKQREKGKEIDKSEMIRISDELKRESIAGPDLKFIEAVTRAAGRAPSGGNSQPWKFLFKNGRLYLFLNESRSLSFMDYKHSASFISLGAAIENLTIKASSLNHYTSVNLFPLKGNNLLVAELVFTSGNGEGGKLAAAINKRYTDRQFLSGGNLSQNMILKLKEISREYPEIQCHFLSDTNDINTIGDVISAGDWIRIMFAESHRDFIGEEMRWDKKYFNKVRDGIFVEELDLTPADLTALHLLRDENVIRFLKSNNIGNKLKHISKKLLSSSPLVLMALSDRFDNETFLRSGRLLERMWLHCTSEKVGFQVLNVPLAFILRAKNGDIPPTLSEFEMEIRGMVDKMETLIPDYRNKTDLFIIRIFNTEFKKATSKRKTIQKILEIV